MPKDRQNLTLSHLAVSFKSSVNLCILKSIFHLNICIQYNHFFRRFEKWKLILALISSYPLIWEASTLQISLSGELSKYICFSNISIPFESTCKGQNFVCPIWFLGSWQPHNGSIHVSTLYPTSLCQSPWKIRCKIFFETDFPSKLSIVINQSSLIIFQTTQAISGSRISAICASSQFSLNRTTQGNNDLTSNWSMSQGWIVNKIIYIGSICMIFVVLYLRLVPGSFWRTLEWTKHYS